MQATGDLQTALEQKFKALTRTDLSLGARLTTIAEAVRALSPDFSSHVDQFVKRLLDAEAGLTAPNIDEPMPEFTLPDQDGRLVTLDDMLADGPAIIVFYRGHWCPYCRLTIAALAQIEQDVAPCRIVCITAEQAEYTRAMRTAAQATFPILSDIDNGYAMSLDLAVWINDSMSKVIEGAGWHVPDYQGMSGWILTIPSVFVVRRDGRIAARHIDPDYRRRMELDDLIAASRCAR